MKVNLTKKQTLVILNHFKTDWSYGAGGTFGDGENITDKSDYKMSPKIIEKIERELKNIGYII